MDCTVSNYPDTLGRSFFLSIEIDNLRILKDIGNYCRNRRGAMHTDIGSIQKDDQDVAA